MRLPLQLARKMPIPSARFFAVSALAVSACLFGVVASAEPNKPTPAPPQFDAPPLLAPEPKTIVESAEQDAATPAIAPAVEGEEVLPAPADPSIAAYAGPVTREQHPWARHEPGSWRRLRIVSESFDDRGLLIGRSETFRRETLVDSSGAGYTLRIETTVDVGGRRIPGPTQTIAYGLTADSPEATPEVVENDATAISLAGRAIPCEAWSWTTPTERGEARHTIYYSSTVAPYVLKRERSDVVDGRVVGDEQLRVVRVGAPIEYGGTILDTYHSARERSLNDGGTKREFTVHADRVPGGVLSSGVTETDASGRRIRWSVSRIAEYGARDQTHRGGAVASAGAAEVVPNEIRPRRWFRLLRRGGFQLSEDDLEDLEDELEDLQDEIEDLYDD